MTPNEMPSASSLSAEFTGTHAEIVTALKTVEFGINAKEVNPNQRGVLIETADDTATFTSFDFETAVSVTVPCGTPQTPGSSFLDHSELTKTLTALVAGETKTAADKTPVSLTGDLLDGGGMTIPIATCDIAGFTHPPLPAPALATVDSEAFLAQLKRTLPARGDDATLPALTGVQLTLTGSTLTMAASDRYRFAVADVATHPVHADLPEGQAATALIPGGTLKRLAQALKTHTGPLALGITPDGDWATLMAGQTTITIRTLAHRLPGYSRLFPETVAVSVRIPRTALAGAVKKCTALIKAKGDKHTPLSLLWDADGALTLAPALPEPQDRARLKGIPLPYTPEQGDPTALHRSHMSFRPAFLTDALDAFTGDTINLHNPGATEAQCTVKPVVFTHTPDLTGDGYRHLLMPIRLEPGTWTL
ncbi:DNA polymerase III subunit beta family protein [Streptomyces sp. NPDC055815]